MTADVRQAVSVLTTPVFVAMSEIAVPEPGRAAVDNAFDDRLGEVDNWPGFQGLQVWADTTDPTTLMMISWWDNQESFTSYMSSAAHRRSHQRIPGGAHRPRPKRFRRFQVISQ